METEYRIAIHARTASGFDTIGEFFIGTDRAKAKELFKRLKGYPDDLGDGVLLMDLREFCRGLLVDLHMIQCSLDQVAENCRLITKYQFMLLNLKDP